MALKRRQSRNHAKTPRDDVQASKRRKIHENGLRPRLQAGSRNSKQKGTKSLTDLPSRSKHNLGQQSERSLRKKDNSRIESGSEIDSDEAFGESDEERFEGFTFRGSTSSSHKLADSGDGFEDTDEDEYANVGLGDESEVMFNGIDDGSIHGGTDEVESPAAQNLDNDEDWVRGNVKQSSDLGIESKKEPNLRSARSLVDDMSDLDVSEQEVDNERSVKQLHDLIKSLPEDEDGKSKPVRSVSAIEMLTPSDHHMPVNKKLTLQDLLPTLSKSPLKRSLKLIAHNSGPGKQQTGKLDAPLPKIQQGRLDRVAANQKAKETLDRWVDTVKLNRRADHISFPLEPHDKNLSQQVPSIQHNSGHTPATDLEAAIEVILRESGLKNNGKGPEKDLQLVEKFEVDKLPVEEALARKARLRKTRDLLFREEIRAKRIKKIKSKAYRRVHRRERKQNLSNSLDVLDYTSHDITLDEKDRLDRLRAEQRMNTKHRESKWAQDARITGRSSWDKETQVAMSELGDRNEQLRRRIEGKPSYNTHNDWMNDFSADESSSDESEDDTRKNKVEKDIETVDLRGRDKLLKALRHSEDMGDGNQTNSTLVQLTQRANKNIKAENDEQAHLIHQELVNGERSSSEADSEILPLGRRSFGSKEERTVLPIHKNKKHDFEEEEEEEKETNSYAFEEPDRTLTHLSVSNTGRKPRSVSKSSSRKYGEQAEPKGLPNVSQRQAEESNPWLTELPKESTYPSTHSRKVNDCGPDTTQKATKKSKAVPKARVASEPKTDKRLEEQDFVDEGEDSDAGGGDLLAQNHDLIKEAFAGDGVFEEFKKEKRAVVTDEAEKSVDQSLPGWGSWVGEGISKKTARRNRGKYVEKIKGVQADKRKDAKLSRVIINEKKVKKNASYMATSLPHPFETRGQYEKSLRLPVGRSWTTSETYLNAIKPRVLVKPNTIIQPLRAPIV